MTSAAPASAGYDNTHLVHVLRQGALLGALQAALVLAFSLVSRFLDGTPELALRAVIVLTGIAATTVLPGLWTRARSIEGIAGAAGIGLWATVVFTLIDSLGLQWIGTYTNRWHEIGGGSSWWYLPVWWMAGTYLSWLGGFALANTAARSGNAAPVNVLVLSVVLAVVIGAAAAVAGFPGAQIGLGTIAVAYLPAIALTVVLTGMGARRQQRVRFIHFVARLVGWLLTPLIAWAASFFGAWVGAGASTGIAGADLSLGLTIMGGAAAGVGATMLWMRLLRRSPQLRDALAVTMEGIPVAAVEESGEEVAKEVQP